MIYFVFAFMSWLKGALDMITGNCAQSVVPRHGEESHAFGLLRYFIGDFIADLSKCICFESCDGFFLHGFEEDRPKDSAK